MPVGFWCLKSCPRFLSWAAAGPPAACDCGYDALPARTTPPLSPQARAAVLRHLARGALESFELGPSWCRVCRAGPDARLGVAAATDGAFVWPSGYSHYVRAHGERPPDALVALALAEEEARAGGEPRSRDAAAATADGAERVEDTKAVDDVEADVPPLPTEEWDAEARARRPVPPATLEWLRLAQRPAAGAAAGGAAAR